MCGETVDPMLSVQPDEGLSPRVRGNRSLYHHLAPCSRSIPACAGKPFEADLRPPRAQVYPRVCGETDYRWSAFIDVYGLSPRVRGNLLAPVDPVSQLGAIPACAGKPNRAVSLGDNNRVYPRVCGETEDCPNPGKHPRGLSPRVRGNLDRLALAVLETGSIPACAGKPNGRLVHLWLLRVYPRVCGETASSLSGAGTGCGLSPRVRGNQLHYLKGLGWCRSIPACAGKPTTGCAHEQADGVYPRVCGET